MSDLYFCELCDYKTSRKANIILHNNSDKHKLNEAKEDKNIYQFKCKYCDVSFTKQQAKSRHENGRCKTRIDKEKELQKKEESEATIVKLLKEQVDLVKEKYDLVKEQLDFTKEEIKMYQKYLETHCDITHKSMNTLNFVMTYFTNAPQLTPIENYEKFHLKDRDRKDLESILIYQYKEGSLYKYIGTLIEEEYKKEKPNTQQFWASDVSRLTYVVNTIVKNISGWHVDKGGLILKDKLIQPVIDFIKNTLETYYDKITKDFASKIYEDSIDYTVHKIQTCWQLCQHIEAGKLTDEILKYIAPVFHLNKNLRSDENKKAILTICDNN